MLDIIPSILNKNSKVSIKKYFIIEIFPKIELLFKELLEKFFF